MALSGKMAVIGVWVLTACGGGGSSPESAAKPLAADTAKAEYKWTRVLDSAGWRKSYNYQLFSIRDTLWVMHPDGAWYSADGERWARSPLGNSIGNQAFLDYVYFRGALYGLGFLTGNIEQNSFRPLIFRSADMRHWDTLSLRGNLPARFFYHPFVFRDRIWIVGGEDAERKYADIWSSADGISWSREVENAAFGPRSGSQVVQLGDTLYLLDNDVWVSADALHWDQRAEEIVPGQAIFGYSAQVYDGKIWLLGCNRNGQFTSQVLYSADGKGWRSQDAPWFPRGGIAATVHRGRIYMTGGKYGGTPNHPDFRYDNDLWWMGRK